MIPVYSKYHTAFSAKHVDCRKCLTKDYPTNYCETPQRAPTIYKNKPKHHNHYSYKKTNINDWINSTTVLWKIRNQPADILVYLCYTLVQNSTEISSQTIVFCSINHLKEQEPPKCLLKNGRLWIPVHGKLLWHSKKYLDS